MITKSCQDPVFAFAPIVALLLGLSSIIVPWNTLILSVVLYIVVPVIVAQLWRRTLMNQGGPPALARTLRKLGPLSLSALLLTLVLLFGLQGEQIMRQPVVIVLLAIPILIQVYFNAGLAYWVNRKLGVEWCVAGPSALIGASNFFELAVATAIALFGFQSGAALSTVVGVLVEVPVMLSVVHIVRRSRGWYEWMTWTDVSRRRGVVVSTLGITQTLAWGSTYYLPAIFADPISAELHLSRAWFFGIFSAALLLSGLLGPLAGRIIDRRGGHDVLAATSLIFAAGLVLLSFASGVVGLTVAWTVIGIGMGFGLYEAAFATVAGLYGHEARNAITGITLFAGFASTVGWPTSAAFIHAFGWHGACLAWAALHLLVGLPLNRLLVPKGLPLPPEKAPDHVAPTGVPWTMIVLAAVFGATWFVSTAMAAHLPRLLEALGSTPAAAIFAASLVGPAQVTARLVEFTLLRRASAFVSARLATRLHPIAALLLAILGPAVAIPFVLLHGAGNEMLTIARGTLPLALFGAAGYGLRNGILSAPARILQGAAPLVFGLVLDRGRPLLALLFSGTLTGLSFLALLLLRAPAQSETM